MTFTTVFRRIDRRHGGYYDAPSIFAGEARAMIVAARARGLLGPSKINRWLTREQAADILEKSITAYADDAPIHPMVAKNILREFGPTGGGA